MWGGGRPLHQCALEYEGVDKVESAGTRDEGEIGKMIGGNIL